MEIERFEHNGYVVRIETDDFPTDPRNDDNLGIMTCVHTRHILGDRHHYQTDDFTGWDDFERHLVHDGAVAVMPLYLYEHSGIGISTRIEPTWYHYAWDGGRIGFIYTTRERIKQVFGWSRLTKERWEKVKCNLLDEVETYNQYLNGDVYGYVIEDADGDEVESLWGLWGYEYAVDQARNAVKYLPVAA